MTTFSGSRQLPLHSFSSTGLRVTKDISRGYND